MNKIILLIIFIFFISAASAGTFDAGNDSEKILQDINSELILFKLYLVKSYLIKQYNMLKEYGLLSDKAFINALYPAVEEYFTGNLKTYKNETIICFDRNNKLIFPENRPLPENEILIYKKSIDDSADSVNTLMSGMNKRAAAGFYSKELEIYIVLIYDMKQ